MASTKGVSRHYPALSPDERLALMLAAAARGDGEEVGRVSAASPRRGCTVPDLDVPVRAFMEVSYEHAIRRLEALARHLLEVVRPREVGPSGAADATARARLSAYLLVAHADGWGRFCAARKLDPATTTAMAAGGDLLARLTATASGYAFSEEQARAYHDGSQDRGPDRFRTAADVAAELERWYADRLAYWG